MTKEKQLWPGWRYGPNGEKGIFNSEEEVPEGWVANICDIKPVKVSRKETPSQAGSLGDEEAAKKAAAKLVDDHTQAELVAKLEEMNEARADDAQLEFLDSWPKAKLAALIVANTEETGE